MPAPDLLKLIGTVAILVLTAVWCWCKPQTAWRWIIGVVLSVVLSTLAMVIWAIVKK